ncbi:uncharacterized protein LOC117285187 [Fukomys damarensis]|uniref:uncharacterized protein LOC117285187 n=1 Tax=Fukomys damarensis TaxID=885580 RepID=UPI001455009C|nr:uncharacterized protein LOC117285187 [Fukomys damarensis]
MVRVLSGGRRGSQGSPGRGRNPQAQGCCCEQPPQALRILQRSLAGHGQRGQLGAALRKARESWSSSQGTSQPLRWPHSGQQPQRGEVAAVCRQCKGRRAGPTRKEEQDRTPAQPSHEARRALLRAGGVSDFRLEGPQHQLPPSRDVATVAPAEVLAQELGKNPSRGLGGELHPPPLGPGALFSLPDCTEPRICPWPFPGLLHQAAHPSPSPATLGSQGYGGVRPCDTACPGGGCRPAVVLPCGATSHLLQGDAPIPLPAATSLSSQSQSHSHCVPWCGILPTTPHHRDPSCSTSCSWLCGQDS